MLATVSCTISGRLLASSNSADVRAKTSVGHQKVHQSVSTSRKQSNAPEVQVPEPLPVAAAFLWAISIWYKSHREPLSTEPFCCPDCEASGAMHLKWGVLAGCVCWKPYVARRSLVHALHDAQVLLASPPQTQTPAARSVERPQKVHLTSVGDDLASWCMLDGVLRQRLIVVPSCSHR